MGRLFLQQLQGRIYSCGLCHTHLAEGDKLVSKGFRGYHGDAYLFADVVNVSFDRSELRFMTSGIHTVADMTCNGCDSIVGWKYLCSQQKSQKYKEGKFILERSRINFGDWSRIENVMDVAPPIDSDPEMDR